MSKYRIGIQILSFNRPKYLEQTLNSLMEVIDPEKDKIAIIEQSDDNDNQDTCIKICQKFNNIQVYPIFKNFGQRGATNYLYSTGFWNDCDYVMLSDHDNLFHANLTEYINLLEQDKDIWIATGYHSPEHDVENKKDNILYKSTCRAGHVVMRSSDFLTLMPLDETAGTASWYAGLDWSLTHWSKGTPGFERQQFIACLLDGVEHIGVDSCWQGNYTDEYPRSELQSMRNMSLYDLIKKYPPRHTYVTDKYWYEKISDDEFYKSSSNGNYEIDIDSNKFDISDISTFPKLNPNIKTLAFNYIWPSYGITFLEKSIESALKIADQYLLILHTKSYLEEPAPLKNIEKVINIAKKFGDKVILAIHDLVEPDGCREDNIKYHILQVAKAYKEQSPILFLIQSDEIYDNENIDKIQELLKIPDSITCHITNPLCYIDNPMWVVNPPELFTRPTIISSNYLKFIDYNYSKLEKEKTDIYFDHFSYVLTNKELDLKFKNWGHRDNIAVNNREIIFKDKFDKCKTNKKITDLHPINPELYKSLKFNPNNSKLNLIYLQELLDDISPIINELFDKSSNDFNNGLVKFFSLTKNDRNLLQAILTNCIPRKSNILVFNDVSGILTTFISSLFLSSNIINVQPVDDKIVYHPLIRRSIQYNFKPILGNAKTLSCFNNDFFDFVFIDTNNPDILQNAFIEIWPKVKTYGYLCGSFANSLDLSPTLLTLLNNHEQTCPWGREIFGYYESFVNLSLSLNTLKGLDTSSVDSGLWLARKGS